MTPQPVIEVQSYHRSCLKIDSNTRLELQRAEYWHFLSIQIRWNTIVTFLISFLEIMTFMLAFYSMDSHKVFGRETPGLFQNFKFYCMGHDLSRWETGVTPAAEILFTMHVIIIFLYSTINLMVLSTVPYRYNRFKSKKSKTRGKHGKSHSVSTEPVLLLDVPDQTQPGF